VRLYPRMSFKAIEIIDHYWDLEKQMIMFWVRGTESAIWMNEMELLHLEKGHRILVAYLDRARKGVPLFMDP
jgi:hypothetical protein